MADYSELRTSYRKFCSRFDFCNECPYAEVDDCHMAFSYDLGKAEVEQEQRSIQDDDGK